MASPSPAKRRKLSLGGPITLSAPSTPNNRPARRNGLRRTPVRESYLSPTRASLSRFNPHLLPQSQSNVDAGLRPGSRGSASTTPRRPSLASPALIATAEGKGDLLGVRGDLAPDQTRRTALGGELSASPKRRPRALSGSVFEPRIPRSGHPGVDAARSAQVEGEPESVLQDGSTLDDSAARAHIQELASQSLAELEAAGEDQALGVASSLRGEVGRGPDSNRQLGKPTNRTSRRISKNRAPAKETLSPPSSQGSVPRRRPDAAIRGEHAKPQSTGLVVGAESDLELRQKRRIRDDLLLELAKLQQDVDRYEKAIEKSHQQQNEGPLDPEDVDEIISLIALTDDAPAAPPGKPPRRKPFSITAFLPFSRRVTTKPRPPSLPIPNTATPASHDPIDLPNPLPYLRMFTPLRFTSTVTILPQSVRNRSDDLHQTHTINISSPSNLLLATLSLTHSTTSFVVTDLTITSLSPWAEPELGTWIRDRAKGDSVAGKDIAGICWAIGRYWEAAEKRAQVWTQCEQEFSDLLISDTSHFDHDLHSSMPRDSGMQKPSTAKRKGRRRRQEDDSNGADDSIDQYEQERDQPCQPNADVDNPEAQVQPHHSSISKPSHSRRVLLTHLGRSNLTFHSSDKTQPVQLTISWPITFDWTGEAQARVSATSSVPPTWIEQDTLSSLSKIPEVFSRLLRFSEGQGQRKVEGEGVGDDNEDDEDDDEDNDGSDFGAGGGERNVMGAVRGVVRLLFR
ncbi:MAG: hypothetical protein M1837_001779 [Sclerophora amabilis]|nr:MAG: hypothetical protein M1837_001779 [Sclerophora amabilis]